MLDSLLLADSQTSGGSMSTAAFPWTPTIPSVTNIPPLVPSTAFPFPTLSAQTAYAPSDDELRALWAGLDHSGKWPDLMSATPRPEDLANLRADIAQRGWESVQDWFAAHSPPASQTALILVAVLVAAAYLLDG